MGRYKYVITRYGCPVLDSVEDDEKTFDSYSEAEEEALYAMSCMDLGAEILHMSNPGDYDYDESDLDNMDYEIIDLDDEEW